MTFNMKEWDGKIARLRKWEWRRDRAVSKELYAACESKFEHVTRELVKEAREIVLNDENQIVYRKPEYKIKFVYTQSGHAGREYFRVKDTHPWLCLGYLTTTIDGQQQYVDTDPDLHTDWPKGTPEFEELKSAFGWDSVGRSTLSFHASDMTLENLKLVCSGGSLTTTSAVIKKAPDVPIHRAHVHWAPPDEPQMWPSPLNWIGHTDKSNKEKEIDMRVTNDTNPDDLEAAAAHALAEAARLRKLDELEPDVEEATISWTWTPDREGATSYTYVAFKAGNGRWYATGQEGAHLCGATWRSLVNGIHNAALREGKFHLVTEWAWMGPDEDTEE